MREKDEAQRGGEEVGGGVRWRELRGEGGRMRQQNPANRRKGSSAAAAHFQGSPQGSAYPPTHKLRASGRLTALELESSKH